MKYKFVINAFDGEASAAPASGDSGVTTTSGEEQGTTTPSTDKRPYEEVIKDYKDEFTKDFQKKWDARHKDYMTVKQANKDQGRILERLALKYGLDDPTNITALESAMQEDDDLVSSRAMENGMTIEQQRKLDNIELENKRFREEQQAKAQQEFAQRQYNTWQDEARNLKVIFPSFDFDAELQNEDFRKALGSGISVERAFYMLHGPEITSGAMQYTAQAVRKATEDEMASRAPRPRENGINRQAAAKVSTDVHSMTREQRLEMAKRSMKGENIYL